MNYKKIIIILIFIVPYLRADKTFQAISTYNKLASITEEILSTKLLEELKNIEQLNNLVSNFDTIAKLCKAEPTKDLKTKDDKLLFSCSKFNIARSKNQYRIELLQSILKLLEIRFSTVLSSLMDALKDTGLANSENIKNRLKYLNSLIMTTNILLEHIKNNLG